MKKIEIKKRTHRRMTATERARHDEFIADFKQDKAAIMAKGAAAIKRKDRLAQTLRLLKEEPERIGMTLTDLSIKSGIDRARLSRLENIDANPTIGTLNRLAAALGKEINIELIDAKA